MRFAEDKHDVQQLITHELILLGSLKNTGQRIDVNIIMPWLDARCSLFR